MLATLFHTPELIVTNHPDLAGGANKYLLCTQMPSKIPEPDYVINDGKSVGDGTSLVALGYNRCVRSGNPLAGDIAHNVDLTSRENVSTANATKQVHHFSIHLTACQGI